MANLKISMSLIDYLFVQGSWGSLGFSQVLLPDRHLVHWHHLCRDGEQASPFPGGATETSRLHCYYISLHRATRRLTSCSESSGCWELPMRTCGLGSRSSLTSRWCCQIVFITFGDKQISLIFTVLNITCLIGLLTTADLPQLVDNELEGIDEEVGAFWTGPVGPDAGNY